MIYWWAILAIWLGDPIVLHCQLHRKTLPHLGSDIYVPTSQYATLPLSLGQSRAMRIGHLCCEAKLLTMCAGIGYATGSNVPRSAQKRSGSVLIQPVRL
jgi:hypothetical protein